MADLGVEVAELRAALGAVMGMGGVWSYPCPRRGGGEWRACWACDCTAETSAEITHSAGCPVGRALELVGAHNA